MKKNMSNFLALVVVLSFFAVDLFGQDFTNNVLEAAGKGYRTGTSGKMRMKADDGKFNGTNAYGTATYPMPGTVEWTASCAVDLMTVGGYHNGTSFQPTYYTNLTTNGTDNKTFQEDIYISGTYTPGQGATPGTRDYTTNTVAVNFTGTTGTQQIPGENTINGTGYYDVVLGGAGLKDVASGHTVLINNDFTHAGGALTNNGVVTLGAAAGTSDADITNADGSKWNFGSGAFAQSSTFTNNAGSTAGNGVYLGTGDGAVTLNNFVNTTGEFDAASATTINMGGAFTAAGGAITFACDANFNYTGAAQTILPKSVAPYSFASYGNLSLAGTGAKTAGGDVDICNILTVSQETGMSTFTLTMLNTGAAPAANYVGDVEVEGKFKWNSPTTTPTYTFNNANTKVKFATAPTSYQLEVHQNTAPSQYATYDPAIDVKRRIIASFTGTGVISDLQLAWETGDEPGGYTTADNSLIRFAEGYDATNTAPAQKIIRAGANYTRTVGASPRYVMYNGGSGPGISLIAGTGGGTVREMTSGSDIAMTQAPMEVISIISGRWSNPDTWDTGLMPLAADNVKVQHLVYTGIDNGPFGTSAYTGDEINGATAGDPGAAANRIIIDNLAGAALVLGNQDTDMGTGAAERLFRTRLLSGSNYIDNRNTTANTGDGEGTSATGINGLWVRAAGSFTPVLGTYQLTNVGNVQNNSIIEVGICN